MTAPTWIYRDRVLHVPSGRHVDYVGAGNPGEVWVWFDDESEPCTVPADELEAAS